MQPYLSHEAKMSAIAKILEVEDGWMTRRQISKKIGYSSSEIIIDAIEEMVERGWVEKSIRPRPQGVAAYIYRRAFWTDENKSNPNTSS